MVNPAHETVLADPRKTRLFWIGYGVCILSLGFPPYTGALIFLILTLYWRKLNGGQ